MEKSFAQLVTEAKALLAATTPADVLARLEAGEGLTVIDVREPHEWAAGLVPGAIPIPRGVLEGQVDGNLPRDAPVVLYCGGGGRSALAGKSLLEMGYSKVENLEGGFGAWVRAGLPVARPTD